MGGAGEDDADWERSLDDVLGLVVLSLVIAASIGSAAGVVSPAVYSLIVVLALTRNLLTPLFLAYCHTGKELVPAMLPTAPSLGVGPDA